MRGIKGIIFVGLIFRVDFKLSRLRGVEDNSTHMQARDPGINLPIGIPPHRTPQRTPINSFQTHSSLHFFSIALPTVLSPRRASSLIALPIALLIALPHCTAHCTPHSIILHIALHPYCTSISLTPSSHSPSLSPLHFPPHSSLHFLPIAPPSHSPPLLSLSQVLLIALPLHPACHSINIYKCCDVNFADDP